MNERIGQMTGFLDELPVVFKNDQGGGTGSKVQLPRGVQVPPVLEQSDLDIQLKRGRVEEIIVSPTTGQAVAAKIKGIFNFNK